MTPDQRRRYPQAAKYEDVINHVMDKWYTNAPMEVDRKYKTELVPQLSASVAALFGKEAYYTRLTLNQTHEKPNALHVAIRIFEVLHPEESVKDAMLAGKINVMRKRIELEEGEIQITIRDVTPEEPETP